MVATLSWLLALIPAPSAGPAVPVHSYRGEESIPRTKGKGGKGCPGDEGLQTGPQGAARDTVSPGSEQRDYEVGRGLGRVCWRGCDRGDRPGVLAGALSASEIQERSKFWRLGSWAGVRREAGALRVISLEAKGTPFVILLCV